jgi:hypothetical protein
VARFRSKGVLAMMWLIVLGAVLGGLIAYHMDGRRRHLSSAVWRGVIIGAVVGLILPLALGVVGAIVHLVFGLVVIAIVVLGVLTLIHMLR